MHTLRVDDFFVSPDTAPEWWTVQPGAWGCLMAHRAALQRAIDEKLRDVLILEGDAELAGGPRGVGDPEAQAAEFFQTCLSRIPDLDVLYVGGQFLNVAHDPPRIAGVLPFDGRLAILLRGGEIERAHAYCVTWDGIRKIVAAIDGALDVHASCHFDSLLRSLQSTGAFSYFAVAPWLYGQAAHESAVLDQFAPADEWQLSDAEWRLIAERSGPTARPTRS